jgi:DNA-binding NarL/FixJ family response regulator
MPVMGGEEALREILAIRPSAKVVIISGYDESDAMTKVRSANVAGFLQKPFTAGRLAHKVREVLLNSSVSATS